jgi:hypothetical protein
MRIPWQFVPSAAKEGTMDVILKPGDVFLTKGPGFFSWLIRFFSRSLGESRAKVNHAGVVVKEGALREAEIVESVAVARRGLLWTFYGPRTKNEVAVYRPLNVTPEQVGVIVATAGRQVGKKYGKAKLAAHLLDYLLLGAYVFRRLANNGDYPICSWLVAHAFGEAGLHFGVEPGAAEPDDIWDFVTEHKDKYACVHPLAPLRGEPAGPAVLAAPGA